MKAGVKYNAQQEEQNCMMQAMQLLQGFQNDLYQKAGVVDKRYLFF